MKLPVADVLLSIGPALMLVVGGLHVLAGSMSIGVLLVVVTMYRALVKPFPELYTSRYKAN